MKPVDVMTNDFKLAYREELRNTELQAERKLEVIVLYTGVPSTLSALQKAGELARGLNARIRLVVAQVVPYPLSLETPPVLIEFNEQRLRAMATAQKIETHIDIFLCRDMDDLLSKVLPKGSTVVIGGRKRVWRSAEERLAARLRRKGYETIFTAGDHIYA
jgi:hypothetical protein